MQRTLLIVGGGVAGWLSALALARASAGYARVVLVDTGEPNFSLGLPSPAVAVMPATLPHLAALGIDEDMLIRRAQGAFSLGAVFADWCAPGESWFLPYGATGAPMGGVAFHHLAARLRQSRALRLADFSLAAVAAQAGRFARPSTDPRSPLSSYGYGLMLEREGLATVARERALACGVEQAEARFARAEWDADGIAAVLLSDGTRLSADLFLDCTGAEARLIGGAPDAEFEDWREWFACDTALVRRNAAEGTPPPFSIASAHTAGWRHTVPLQGGQSDVLLYASEQLGHGEAAAAFPEARRYSFVPGSRARFWSRNCVALGATAAMFEPLHPIALHLLLTGAERLAGLLPHDATCEPEAGEYNRLIRGEVTRARDFLITHYKTSNRPGEPFWDAARAMPVPDALRYKLDLYASRGRVAQYDDETFEREEWIALFDAQGVRPRRYDASADMIPEKALLRHFDRLRDVIVRSAGSLPGHGATLANIGGER